ncbi:MAG: DUF1638 domain-containing protein [Actinobacteria bacterium]|nr:DUF1638 domain-containing protein [Actinomycetota bacterium]
MARPLVLACGALVSELRAVLASAELAEHVDVRYLPANLHSRPEGIEPALRALLDELDPGRDRPILLGYADCGTGGGLDRLLAERPNIRRLPGSHCYEFFTGSSAFESLHAEELGTFFLTDFLAKHFDAIIWQGLALDRHPELLPMYFGNYTRIVLLSQQDDANVVAAAREAANRLGLGFEHRHVGLAQFHTAVTVALSDPRPARVVA